MDEIEVPLKRNKKKLEKIRNDRQGRQLPRNNSTSTGGGLQGTTAEAQSNVRLFEGANGYTEEGNRGADIISATSGRSDSEQRYPFAENEHSAAGYGGADEQAGESALSVDEIERRRELTRQRVQRYRDRQKKNSDSQAQNAYSDVTSISANGNNNLKFRFKSMFAGNSKEPVKLFTKAQAEGALEDLAAIYTKGTSLLDDILEIIVNDHEKVQIWEDEDTARMLAAMHLQAAQKSMDAARVAYALLKLKDKMFIGIYLLTRSKATHAHVVAHGGFSFK